MEPPLKVIFFVFVVEIVTPCEGPTVMFFPFRSIVPLTRVKALLVPNLKASANLQDPPAPLKITNVPKIMPLVVITRVVAEVDRKEN